MKRIVWFTLVLVVAMGCIVGPVGEVFADEATTMVAGEYLKVSEDVTLISANFGRNEICAVPATYYVQFLGYDEDAEVNLFKYMDIEGTLSDDDVKKLQKQTDSSFENAETDKNPNLDLTVVTDVLDVSVPAIKSNKNGKKSSPTAENFAAGTPFDFLGFLTYQETKYAFVKASDGAFWYIPADVLLVTSVEGKTIASAKLSSYVIPQHYFSRPPVEIIDPQDPSTDTGKKDNLLDVDNNVLRILLIIGIVLPAVIIIFLLFKPAAKKHGYDYDRNRNYDAGPSPYDQPRSRYRDDDYYDRRYRRDDYYDSTRRGYSDDRGRRDPRDDRDYRDDRY